VIAIAMLGLIYADSLTRLNFLKQAIAFSVNITAAVYFAFCASRGYNGKVRLYLVI